jgi:dolichyl-phosphate beta-glucosyltransferase
MPVYNEAAGIAAAMQDVTRHLRAASDEWELLVVDNASTDGTPERLAPFLSDPRVRLLRNADNRGKGYSVRRGMLAARGELRLHCDADCAGSLASLPRLLAAVHEGADVVVGSRLAPGADIGRRQPLGRRIVGRSFVDLCRLVLREPTRDLFCGFKLWRAAAAEAAYARTRLDGWAFDAETLAMARALGFRVRELGVVWSDRPGSRLSMARSFGPVLADLVRARRHVTREAARAGQGAVVEAPDASP